MGKASRDKGGRGEREFAAFICDHGYEAHRGRQYCGSPDSPDVVSSVSGVSFEVKRTERLYLWAALQQAHEDAPDDAIPVVAHRSNRRPWVVILTAADFLKLTQEAGR